MVLFDEELLDQKLSNAKNMFANDDVQATLINESEDPKNIDVYGAHANPVEANP